MDKKHILICDDDEGILDVAKIVLEDKGYQVLIQQNAERVVVQIEQDMPDLVFLDLWMPTGSGEDITREIKGNPKTKSIAVVIVSANIDTQKIAERAGADAFLCKPFDITQLEQMADRFLT